MGQPVAIYRVNPALMEVVPGRVTPAKYIYNVPNAEPQEWSADSVLHIKLPNPHDPWRGLGVIAGNPTMYDIALAVDQSIQQYYAHGTRLSGVLQSDRTIPENTWNKIKRQFTNLYSGQRNAYTVAMLERGLKFNAISGNASESQFGPAQEQSRDRIAAAFGIPTPLLGDVGGSTDRQAVREAQRIFDNKIMRPFLDMLQSKVSAGLTQAWDVDWCVEYEFVMAIEDKMELASNLTGMPVTADELRNVIDLPPLGGEKGSALLSDPTTKPPPPPQIHKPGPDEPEPKKVGGSAPYPAGAAGRTGEPTTADGEKALSIVAEALAKVDSDGT
jgi:HK97 family phage portal protein